MKKRLISLFLSLTLILTAIPAFSLTAGAETDDTATGLPEDAAFFAKDDAEETASTGALTYDVAAFGADGTDKDDDTDAIQEALNQSPMNGAYITVSIPAGTYYIRKALKIFSNTDLVLDAKTTIIANMPDIDSAMLYGAHRDENGVICSGAGCTHGGYTQVRHVNVYGGVWDRNDPNGKTDSGVMAFRHAGYITIKNTTVKNCTDHFINVSGSESVDIENVTIQDAVKYTGDSKTFWGSYAKGNTERFNALEAIHIDYLNAVGESTDAAMPLDDTASKLINVRNCTFKNIFAGVGTHHPAPATRASSIVVENCTATDIRSYLAIGQDYDRFIVRNNTVIRGGAIGSFSNCKAQVYGNTFTANSLTDGNINKNAIFAFGGTELNAHDNTITSAKLTAISLTDEGTIGDLRDNDVISPSLHGVSVQNGASVYATGNKIKAPGGVGFYMNFGYTLGNGIVENTINSCGTHALYIYDGEAKFSTNTVNTTKKTAIRADGGAKLAMNGNTISSAGEFAVNATGGCVMTITNNIINGSGASKPAVKVMDSKSSISSNKIYSSDNHGIVVWESNGSTISNNTIVSPNGVGIHIYSSTGITAATNTVTGAKSHAFLIEGESTAKPAAASIMSNKFTTASASSADIRLGKYTKNCQISGNTLGNNRLSVDSTATYVELLATPVLKGAACAYGGVQVTWVAVPGAKKYRVFRKTASSGWAKVSDVTGASVLDKTAKSGTTYTYTVRCITADGKTYQSLFDSVGKSVSYYAAPVVSKLENLVGGTRLTWGRVAGASKYVVFVKSGSSWKKLGVTAATTFTNAAVKSGTKYTYTVRAANASEKFISAFNSTGWTYAFISAPALPTLKNSKNGVVITLKKPAGASKVRVFRKTAKTGWVKVADTTALTVTDKTAKNGTTYSYTVRCINAAGTAYTSAYNTTGKSIKCVR